jgi:hypothetical protein
MGYNGELCRVHRGASRLWTTLTAGGLAAHHFALTVRARDLDSPSIAKHPERSEWAKGERDTAWAF